jgi:cytochrome c-type biogenesis protein CcmH
MVQGRPDDAARMFERTVSLAGRRPELLGEWAKALYFSNNKMWSAPIKALTDEALNGNPGELVSLSLIGLAAFEEHRYQDALKYWNQALAEMGSDHPSRAALVQAIGKARDGLSTDVKTSNLTSDHVGGLPPTLLQVRVEISPEIIEKVALDDSVFVFVQALSGSKVPLAAKRLKVSSLPVEVEFSDADAMFTSNTLSQAAEIQVTARVSREGTRASGEWLGRSSTTINSKSTRLKLTIDRPDI